MTTSANQISPLDNKPAPPPRLIPKSSYKPLAALFLLSLISLAAISSAETESQEFTLTKFLEIPTLNSPVVSPDGTQVAWRHTYRDLEGDTRITRLWLGQVKTGEARQLTFTEGGTGALAWRPNTTGKETALSFIRAHDDAAQVWVNPLDGSEPRPVTAVEGGVSAYWWSPDGKSMIVLADPLDEDADSEEAEDQEGDEEAETKPDPKNLGNIPEEDMDFTVFNRLEQPQDYQQLFLITVGENSPDEDMEPIQLTANPLNPSHVSWSPDAKTIAITINTRFSGLVDEDQVVALIDLASREMEIITPADRHSSFASFSPDGKKLAYFTDRKAELRAYQNLKDIVVRDLDSGEITVVTGMSEITFGGSGSTPGEAPIWGEKGRNIYVRAADGANLDLYRIDVRKQVLTQLTDLAGNLGATSIAAGTVAFLDSALDQPGSLRAGPLKKLPKGIEKMKTLASVNDAVADFKLQSPTLLRLPGHNGGFVEGFLFLPPGATMNDNLPAIVEMHGGPYYRYGNAWTTRYPWQVLSHNGFAVLIVNPRGGTGYGEDFLRGCYRNFGTDDFRDIMAAIDHLVAKGVIDGDRLGFTGYSYGGLMTNVVVSRTDRFKAAVSIAGIWNYVSAMGQNNPQLFIDSYDQPWDNDLQLMWEHSPASRANKITTPTLIMHGQEDHPVDPRQSIEMFSYLQLNGVPSRLVLYPGEGHGINKPSHMIDYQSRELQWFLHYVMGQEDAVGADEPVPVEN